MLVASMREAARQIGVSHTALQKAQRAGRIAQQPCGRWDVVAIQRQLAVPMAQKGLTPQPTPDRAAKGASPTPRPLLRPSPAGPSMREIARQIGVSHTSLQKAKRTGRIAPEPDGCWDIEKVRAGLATRAAPKQRKPYGSRAPWARAAHHITKLDADIVGPARGIHKDLEAARQALERAARQIAALYPEILKLERACDAAVVAQEREAG
jgi:protein-tyrosine-phosphatase